MFKRSVEQLDRQTRSPLDKKNVSIIIINTLKYKHYKMLELHKSYVIDENQQPIAVQIPLEQFEKIEEILENYGLAKLIEETEGDETLSKEQALKYYNSIKQNNVAS